MMPTRYGMISRNAIEHLSSGVRNAFENKTGLLSRLEHSDKVCDLVDKYLKPEMELMRPDFSKNVKSLMKKIQIDIENHLEKDEDLSFDDYLEEIQKIKEISKASIDRKINDKTNAIVNKIKTMYLKDIEASYLEFKSSSESKIESGEDAIAEPEEIIDYQNKNILKNNYKSWISFSPVHKIYLDDLLLACQFYSLNHNGLGFEQGGNNQLMIEKTIDLHFRPTERIELKDNKNQYNNLMKELIKETLLEEYSKFDIHFEKEEIEKYSIIEKKNIKVTKEYVTHLRLKQSLDEIQESLLPMKLEE